MSYVYPEKFMRDNVVALFLVLSPVVVTAIFFQLHLHLHSAQKLLESRF